MTEHVLNDRYRLDGRIGEGGMATVYTGTDTLLRRRVAIKVLRPQYAADADFVQRFYHEAQQAAKLSHPNIVNVYDVGREAEAYFIVMELVDGTTLDEMIRHDGKLPEPVAIDYATQICSGLAYAHRQGLLHRDIKPANILITADDVVKISDFGIARAVSEQTMALTQPGMVMGSVYYLSPEQAQGHELRESSDLYSLGVVLYQMLTGTLPFTGPSAVSVALKHVSESAPPIDGGPGTVSPALAAIVRKLLAKDPAERYSSASELASALREARERPHVIGEAAAVGGASAAEPRPAGAPPPRRSSHPDRQSSGAAAVDNRAALDRARRTGARRTIVTLVAAFIIALIAGVAIIRHGNFTIGGSRFIEDYVGKPADQAESALTHDGYSYTVTLAPSATATSGTVTSQDPIAHLPIGAHGTVHLVVSSGPELVGLVDLRSYSVDDALRFVKNVGLAAKVTEKYDKAAKGMVISQNPAPGTRLAAKSVVKIVVSKGAAPVAVPSLVSLTLDDAKKQLAQRHLNIVVGDRQATDTIAENVVISQDPKPGATAPAGSPVTVVVSTGPAQTGVPDVGSQSGADATNALNALGFRVRYNYVVQAGGIVGSVIAQFPAPGTPLAKGASVTLSIVVPGTVPDVGGLSLDRARGALQNSGYHAGRTIVVRQADGAPGSVARTDPAANVRLEPGASVDLYVIAAPNAAPAASGP